MGNLEDLVAIYAEDLKEQFGEKTPDMELLNAIVTDLGPAIHEEKSSTVSDGDKKGKARIKNNYVKKKLNVKASSEEINKVIAKLMADYGDSDRTKHLAVIHYKLSKHFGNDERAW